MNNKIIPLAIKLIKARLKNIKLSIVDSIAEIGDPWKVLISTVLSLRTKDEVTEVASLRLFKIAPDPVSLLKLSQEKISTTIYPVGFYKRKAQSLLKIANIILNQYRGKVPDDLEELLKLPGVGRKTANLVLAKGYGIPAICVDTHVHRITNRWGYVNTKNPLQTEMELRKKLPEKYWIDINGLLVLWGQNICKPISPFCSKCDILQYCKKVGVIKNR